LAGRDRGIDLARKSSWEKDGGKGFVGKAWQERVDGKGWWERVGGEGLVGSVDWERLAG
jgi:hypothetical protein